MAERRAVIDVGSNSVLLTVAEGPDWSPIRETSEVTALGEDTKQTGRLSEPAMERTLAAVHRAYALARALGCQEVLAAATMAARIASNAGDFLARAAAQATPIIVLSGEEEAELGFRSVADDPTWDAHHQGTLTIIDVGGHSTELVTAERRAGHWDVRFRRSFPVGTLGLRASLLSGERCDGLALLRAAKAIDEAIGLDYLPGTAGLAVALGATGTNLVTIREAMPEWDSQKVHGAFLDYEEVSKAAGFLGAMSDAERAAVVGIEPGRERTIHIGSLILERFLYATRVLGCGVSTRGWRHALLARMSEFARLP